ncbi:MAG: MarR family transcriptional regulator [Pseudomonadota bacterium]
MASKENYIELYNQLQSYARLYTFRDPNVACLFGLRVNECYVLDYIANNAPVTVSHIADELGIHKSNVSRIIASLESEGLVAHKGNTNDARQKVVDLSPKGERKHQEVQTYFVDRLRNVLREFTAGDIETAKRFIEALTDDAATRILENSPLPAMRR